MKQVKRSKIKENPNNPRIIKDHKYYLLVKSLQEFPEMLKLRPIVVDEDMMVLGGNKRLKASKDAGLKEVWIEIAEGLTEAQKKEFVIKDNTNYGEWDWDILANKWDSVQLIEWGVDVWENQDDIKVEPIAGLTDDDDVPEAEESICKAGDIWGLGNHRLLCGDATKKEDVERLMDGNKADMVFTSPPYNGNTSVGFKQNKKGGMKTTELYNNNESDNKTKEENILFNNYIFSMFNNICLDDAPIFYNINYNRNSPSDYIDIVFNAKQKMQLVETICWKKAMAISLAGDNLTRIFEFIFLFTKTGKKPKMNKKHTNECVKNIWDITNVGANTETHKACFPVSLVEYAIKYYAINNGILFEPFTGSGSTLIACEKTKRKCYGMEIDPHYCDVIVKRWEEFTGNKAEKLDGKTEKV
jgi:DNA modification methylase